VNIIFAVKLLPLCLMSTVFIGDLLLLYKQLLALRSLVKVGLNEVENIIQGQLLSSNAITDGPFNPRQP